MQTFSKFSEVPNLGCQYVSLAWTFAIGDPGFRGYGVPGAMGGTVLHWRNKKFSRFESLKVSKFC